MNMSNKHVWWFPLAGIVVATAILLPLASSLPDGLERVAEMVGFDQREHSLYRAPFHDYALPRVENKFGEVVSVAFGIALAAGAMLLIGKSLARSKARSER